MTKQDATRFEQLISSYDEANAAGDTELLEQLAVEICVAQGQCSSFQNI